MKTFSITIDVNFFVGEGGNLSTNVCCIRYNLR